MKFRYLGWFFLFPALAGATYEYFNLVRSIDSEKLQFVSGEVSALRTYNGFSSFEVEGVVFRMQSFTPCIDQRKNIRDDLEVNIKFKLIPRWPGTFESYGCIVEIEYIGEVQSKRTGQMSRGT
ncbi:hypothetical protein KDX31_02835 [Amphritea atlantica]|uniref:Uncharacterized protein n=1 Tax=Amphritea atlantica TaxID=355243 RepID=A0ABY5GY20_9GAMM|nr:hypothetical protein KDX31_02835 [Amphritea atlantica]